MRTKHDAGVHVPALADTYQNAQHVELSPTCLAVTRAVTEALFQTIPIRVEWTGAGQS